MKKKLISAKKRDLKFLIEDFLENQPQEISSAIKNTGDAENFWNHLEAVLFKDTFWGDEVEAEDKIGTDFEKLILEYHNVLEPIWRMFREAIFDFKFRIIPGREKTLTLKEKIEDDVFSILYQYKELLNQESVIDWEKFYDIEIKLKVSFDPGHVAFYKRNLDALNNFLELLGNVPIYYFSSCEYCGKCIILTRNNKRYCRGCAAKKFQKDKWQQNPEAMKEKERIRYRDRRKKS